jgi:phosphoglycolate phosphatase
MRLIIFDCDGTLVDSQHAIVASMAHAYATLGLEAPSRAEILSIVGLSLPECFQVLAPRADAATRAELARLYKAGWPATAGEAARHDPLYDGARGLVTALAARDDVVLGVATGKSRRGVARLLEREGWHGHFLTIQTADDNPSKPHPAMIQRAMAEAGAEPHMTVMIGDTSYDMAMARNALVGALGAGWGYHAAHRLHEAGAHAVATTFDELAAAIEARFAAQDALA